MSHVAVIQTVDISNCKAVIGYVECPYTTSSFRVVHGSTHKMAYQEVTAMCFSSRNSHAAVNQKSNICDHIVICCVEIVCILHTLVVDATPEVFLPRTAFN